MQLQSRPRAISHHWAISAVLLFVVKSMVELWVYMVSIDFTFNILPINSAPWCEYLPNLITSVPTSQINNFQIHNFPTHFPSFASLGWLVSSLSILTRDYQMAILFQTRTSDSTWIPSTRYSTTSLSLAPVQSANNPFNDPTPNDHQYVVLF